MMDTITVTIKRLIIGLLALWVGLACSAADEDENSLDLKTNALEQEIIATSNGFGFELFNEVLAAGEEENPFISPFSVTMALGMTYQGAAGETASQMRETLGFGGLTDEEIAAAYEHIQAILTNLDGAVTLELANSIWPDDGFEVKPDFLEKCQERFDAEVATVDYGQPEAAAAAINSWVDEKTHGKISKVVAPPFIDVVMYLVNALYFKGTWTYMFDEAETRNDDFTLEDGTKKQVKMMQLQGEVPFQRNSDFLAVDLPYGEEKYAMALLLPAEGTLVDDLAASLDRERWDEIAAGFEMSGQTVRLPRFELEYKTDLKDVLISMGMVDAFDSDLADFSGMTESETVWISKVLHKIFVAVNEQGTEAAAVTAVEVQTKSAAEPEPMPVFNRPFLAVIHDRTTETILFIGKVGNP